MELKSVFDIIKADRYTADGCKEIEDARRRYTVGQTSEATGKVKLANGKWVFPEKEAEQSAKSETKKPSKDVQKKIDEFNKAKAGAQRAADFMNNIKSGMPMSQAFEQSRQEPKAETKTDKTVEAIRNGGSFERNDKNTSEKKQQFKSLKPETIAKETLKSTELTDEQKAQTKAVENRINKNGWFKHPSTLDGMQPEAAANIERQCNRIFKEFPILKGFVESLKCEEFPEEENKIYAKCDGTGKSANIIFNKKFFSNNEALQEEYKKDVEDEYHPRGTTADSLIVHEITHCICDFIAQKRGQDFDDFNRDVIEYTLEEFEKAGIKVNIKTELGKYGIDRKACPIEEIRNAEIIAEAYTEYKCSKAPRRFANFIGHLLEGELE